jgi:hypothetical protein
MPFGYSFMIKLDRVPGRAYQIHHEDYLTAVAASLDFRLGEAGSAWKSFESVVSIVFC